MTHVERLVEHTHTCVVCKEHNRPRTKFDDLVLCAEGQKIRQEAVDQSFWSIVRGLAWVSLLMLGGCAIIGIKLGGWLALAAFLLTWSLRFKIAE